MHVLNILRVIGLVALILVIFAQLAAAQGQCAVSAEARRRILTELCGADGAPEASCVRPAIDIGVLNDVVSVGMIGLCGDSALAQQALAGLRSAWALKARLAGCVGIRVDSERLIAETNHHLAESIRRRGCPPAGDLALAKAETIARDFAGFDPQPVFDRLGIVVDHGGGVTERR